MLSGVYQIRNTTTGVSYIGSSADVTARWSTHRCTLRRGCHVNRYLQRAWLKYGEAIFEYNLLEEVAVVYLTAVEQRYIDYYRRFGLYNARLRAESNRGFTHTAEAKRKIGAASMGRVVSAETRQRISATNRGQVPSAAAIAASIISNQTRVVSAETRARMSLAAEGNQHRVGHSPSAETREKLRQGVLGRVRSAETRQRMSVAKQATFRAVECFDLVTSVVVAEYSSIAAASRAGFSRAGIHHVLAGVNRSHKGFGWRYTK